MEKQEFYYGSTTDYCFSGPNLEVKEAVEDVYNRYPPQGYNTRIVYIEIVSATEVKAVMTRWNTSD